MIKESIMPNWCNNEVSIIAENGEGQEEMKQFIKDCFTEEEEGNEKPLLDFEKVIPYPDSAPPKYPQAINIKEQMKHPFAKWYNDFGYDWCIENWGTKWNACEQVNVLGEDEINLDFQTAWSPPQGIYDRIQTRLPNCSISWFYREDGMQVSGWL